MVSVLLVFCCIKNTSYFLQKKSAESQLKLLPIKKRSTEKYRHEKHKSETKTDNLATKQEKLIYFGDFFQANFYVFNNVFLRLMSKIIHFDRYMWCNMYKSIRMWGQILQPTPTQTSPEFVVHHCQWLSLGIGVRLPYVPDEGCRDTGVPSGTVPTTRYRWAAGKGPHHCVHRGLLRCFGQAARGRKRTEGGATAAGGGGLGERLVNILRQF